jgi:hypothetical protein
MANLKKIRAAQKAAAGSGTHSRQFARTQHAAGGGGRDGLSYGRAPVPSSVARIAGGCGGIIGCNCGGDIGGKPAGSRRAGIIGCCI